MTKVKICDVTFKNPVIAASGTFGFGREFEEFYPIEKLGGISTKGLTLHQKDGNPGIRLWETPSGMMNSIGLQNPGVKGFINEELQFLESKDTVIIANLGGSTLEEYLEGILLLNNTSVDFIELNISCPNVKKGGMAFGIKCETAEIVVSQVCKISNKPVMVKLSPNAEDIKEMAKTCEKSGANAISLINTFSALAIDIYSRKAVFNNITAGLSGPAIKPIALRMVRDVFKEVSIPVIGLGGIMSGSDAIEFIMAGASAIQIGSGNFVDPTIMIKVISEIEDFMTSQGIKDLEEIRGII